MESREEVQRKTDAVLMVLIVFAAFSLIVGLVLVAGIILVLGKAI